VFNRPDTTQRVFNTIRAVRSARLFVAADGSRERIAGEKEKCEEVRDIVNSIDWPREVRWYFGRP
jgi:hypothetical protein